MNLNSPLMTRLRTLLLAIPFFIGVYLPADTGWAKRPPETRNQEQVEITADMHGRELTEYEFIKEDLRGVDLGEADLRGAVFNNSHLEGASLKKADLEDSVAFATGFEGADLRDANFTNALLMESRFDDALIEGADFSNAVLSRIQQKQLCSIAKGTNSSSGIDTDYSLGC